MNPPPADPLLDALHRVAPYAVASGLTPLIPVPFLDDYALRRVRERLVRELLAEHHAGLAVDDATVRALAGHAVLPQPGRVANAGRAKASPHVI